MKGKKRVRRTTLLVIGAILLWGTVALWNELQRSDTGLSTPRSTTTTKVLTDPTNSRTAISPGTNGLKIGTP